MSSFQYQVGGSLIDNAPSYVARQCDEDLYAALKRDEFCYVLNSRQMGKSSLLVQTRHRLQREGYACAVVDITNIGSENITPLQWYKGIITDLWRSFKPLRSFNLKTWWQTVEDLSLSQRFSRFIEDVLLKELPDTSIVIFLDEIDSILSLPFFVDDFFALIRHCYNQRVLDPDYRRINFAIFGVANPSDLIRDRKRTPFNIGTAISLNGFTLEEARPLANGIAVRAGNAQTVLQEILQWTNGQPFLTQKLCQLAINFSQDAVSGTLTIPPGNEAYWVEQLVRTQILQDWETQDEPEHLRTIRNRILNHSEAKGRLLSIYHQILQDGRNPTDDAWEQVELILSGLVVQVGGELRIKNRIYGEVFNVAWVEQQLAQLRPYAHALDAWAGSERRDESRLLRGQALRDAQQWVQGKRLSDLDYQFLAASVESDRQQVQQALEADRVKAIEAQLFQEKRNVRLQRWFLITHSIGLLTSLGLAIGIFLLYRQSQANEQKAEISQVKALVSSSQGSFDSNRQLDALVQAIQARVELQDLKYADPDLEERTKLVLQQSLYGIDEANRFTANVGIRAVAISPNGKWIAAACVDGTLRLWTPEGMLVRTIVAHRAAVVTVAFSPDSQRLLSASSEPTLKVWRLDGTLAQTLRGEKRADIIKAKFSPDGQYIATLSENGTVTLWGRDGQPQRTLGPATAFAFSTQGLLAIAGFGPTRIWQRDGTLLRSIPATSEITGALAFSPDGQTLAQVVQARNRDGIFLWRLDGTLAEVFHGPETAGVRDLAFSPDGRYFATPGVDQGVQLWQRGIGLVRRFQGHRAAVGSVAFRSDGKMLLSASDDRTVRLWNLDNPFVEVLGGHIGPIMKLTVNPISNQIVTVSPEGHIAFFWPDRTGTLGKMPQHSFLGHRAPIQGIAFSPDGRYFATAARDYTITIWTAQGAPVQTLQEDAPVEGVAFSPKGNALAIAAEDGTIKIRPRDTAQTFATKSTQILRGHQAAVKQVAFSPDGTRLISASADRTLKVWDNHGTLLKTLMGHTAEVRDVAFSPDGKHIVSAAADGTLKLWQPDGTLLRTFKGHESAVWAAVFSPDGQYIASSSMDATIKLWRLDGTLVRTLKRHGAAVRSIAFAAKGKWLISGSDDRVLAVWHLDRILKTDEPAYACRWVQNFLRTSPTLQEEQASICLNTPTH